MTGLVRDPPPSRELDRLLEVLEQRPSRVIACSGGIDSLLLATVAHRAAPESTIVAHALSPAVPGAATGRVVAAAAREGWQIQLVETGEFDDERYLANPVDRCYFCKTSLYDELVALPGLMSLAGGWTVLSGANTDDLGEYRPGLIAAAEHGVRHPYVDAGLGKGDIRCIARHLELDVAELPASPCLASRLYTGTRVTQRRLRAVEAGEQVVRSAAGIDVVRCRIRDDVVLVEVPEDLRERITGELLDSVRFAMQAADPGLQQVRLDHKPYRPGRAVLHLS